MPGHPLVYVVKPHIGGIPYLGKVQGDQGASGMEERVMLGNQLRVKGNERYVREVITFFDNRHALIRRTDNEERDRRGAGSKHRGGPWERTVQLGEDARLGDGSYRVAGLYKLIVHRRNHQTLLLKNSGRIEASGAREH